MRSLTLTLAASMAFATAVSAQSPQNEAGPASVGVGIPKALGDVVAGPFDVETNSGPPPGDNRVLGVEEALGSYLVTGRGHTTTGDNYSIHQYDLNGNYVTSFPQVTASTGWAGRDMEFAGGTLYVGSDSGEVSEYTWDGTTLTHVTLNVTGVAGTVRALCQNPTTGNFYTKSFTSDFFEFDLPGGNVINQVFDGSVSAYGFGWDSDNSVIWSSDVAAAMVQIDPVTGLGIGGGFASASATAIQGGVDVYMDPRNPGCLSAVQLGQDAPDSLYVYELNGCAPSCGATVYCTTKVNSLGCSPSITADAGCPTAGGAAYNVNVDMVLNNKPGIIFYGTAANSLPFQGGFLCVQPPVQRTAVQNTGGNPPPNDCTGTMTLDVSALGTAGSSLFFQGWSRDPNSPSTTSLSDGVEVPFQ